MPRRKTVPRHSRQQSLTEFLIPTSSKANCSRNLNTAQTKPRQAGRTAKSPSSRVPEPFDQSDTDSGVEAIHFEPKKAASSDDDDDDIQPSSPLRRRAAVEAESHSDGEISMSAYSDNGIHIKVTALPNKNKSPRACSPSTETNLPKRRRLTKGARPPSPEEHENLLLEVNEAGESRFGSCEASTDPDHRYHTVPLPSTSEAVNFPTKFRKAEK